MKEAERLAAFVEENFVIDSLYALEIPSSVLDLESKGISAMRAITKCTFCGPVQRSR
jgi:hypothetical protein